MCKLYLKFYKCKPLSSWCHALCRRYHHRQRPRILNFLWSFNSLSIESGTWRISAADFLFGATYAVYISKRFSNGDTGHKITTYILHLVSNDPKLDQKGYLLFNYLIELVHGLFSICVTFNKTRFITNHFGPGTQFRVVFFEGFFTSKVLCQF